MARKEFSKSVKVAVIKRATVNGQIYCEACGCLVKGGFDIDHVRPDGLLGEPTLENAKLLCKSCHQEKTKSDVKSISKAKRVEAKHLGAVQAKQKIQSRGFPKREKKEKLGLPPRRAIFEEN